MEVILMKNLKVIFGLSVIVAGMGLPQVYAAPFNLQAAAAGLLAGTVYQSGIVQKTARGFTNTAKSMYNGIANHKALTAGAVAAGTLAVYGIGSEVIAETAENVAHRLLVNVPVEQISQAMPKTINGSDAAIFAGACIAGIAAVKAVQWYFKKPVESELSVSSSVPSILLVEQNDTKHNGLEVKKMNNKKEVLGFFDKITTQDIRALEQHHNAGQAQSHTVPVESKYLSESAHIKSQLSPELQKEWDVLNKRYDQCFKNYRDALPNQRAAAEMVMKKVQVEIRQFLENHIQ
jgi:hypothetical protein